MSSRSTKSSVPHSKWYFTVGFVLFCQLLTSGAASGNSWCLSGTTVRTAMGEMVAQKHACDPSFIWWKITAELKLHLYQES